MATQFDVKNASVAASGSVWGARTRVKGLVITPSAVAGSVVLKDGGSGGVTKLTVTTAADVRPFTVEIPGEGLLFETDVYAVLTSVAAVSVFYG